LGKERHAIVAVENGFLEDVELRVADVGNVPVYVDRRIRLKAIHFVELVELEDFA
jgi:hypothetical protein